MTRQRLLLAATLLCAPAVHAQDAPVTYADHVRPILQQHCFTCHGPDKQSGGLNLSNYAALMGGGSAGEVVSPQDVAGSSLVGVMDHTRQPTMPPNAQPIDAAKIEVVRQWVAQGCRETADSAVRAPSRPVVDLSVGTPTLGRPEGPPLMPRDMPLGPIVHTPHDGAVTSIAGHPWSPIVAVAGQQQVLVYHTDSLELLGVLPYELGQPEVLRFSGTGQLLLAGGGVGGLSGVWWCGMSRRAPKSLASGKKPTRYSPPTSTRCSASSRWAARRRSSRSLISPQARCVTASRNTPSG